METVEYIDPANGRKYEALVNGRDDMRVIKGPPEGLVDSLGLPEPFATTLHNILYARRIFTTADIARDSRSLMGALQEALLLDVQRLTEAYFHYEKEVSNE